MNSNIEIEIKWTDNSDNDSAISYYSSDEVNNISKKQIQQINTDGKPFLLGTSKFNDNCVFLNNYTGFISRVSSDENCNIDFTLIIECVNISNLFFLFDNDLEIYPTKMTINNKTYTIESSSYLLQFDNPITDKLTINFTKMNVANQPLKIKYISNAVRKYDSSQISNLVVGSEISSENSVYFGVIGKYGSFNLKDKNHEISAILKNIEYSRCQVKIYCNEIIIGTFKISDIQQTEGQFEYKISISDYTDDFDNTYVERFVIEPTGTTILTAYDLFLNICSHCNNEIVKNGTHNFIGYSDRIFTSLIKKLKAIRMPILFNINKKSVKEVLNDFCNYAQVNIVINNEGNGLEMIDFG